MEFYSEWGKVWVVPIRQDPRRSWSDSAHCLRRRMRTNKLHLTPHDFTDEVIDGELTGSGLCNCERPKSHPIHHAENCGCKECEECESRVSGDSPVSYFYEWLKSGIK